MNTEAGKTALITGASNGIGQELAKLFAKDGYNLVLIGRNDDKLQQLAEGFEQDYGVQTTVIAKDLSRENVAEEVYNEVTGRGLTINVLVNDAAVSTYGKFATDTDWEREKALIHLNVLTLTHMTKLFLKDMVTRNEGKILQLASLVAITPFPLMAVYAATKAYVYNFTQSLNNELKDTNVTVTALLPNATDTNFFREAGAPQLNVEDQLDDPAVVAKDGYDALMSGKLKVIPGGAMNKAYEVMAYTMPQETLAGMMRHYNTPKEESEREKESSSTTSAWALGLGIAAAVVAGVALVTAYNNADALTRARYRYKATKLKYKANSVLDDAKEALVDSWDKVKHNVQNATTTA
ncbi:SDR family NAD(P)-dependent oxidoreductase [Rudanella paleaurantiibacter]|uniref:SDR family NAD(P)-dependent oxidoreductase n=1 Tax=Rudanella paleaurantiibacter TaxID=2614655 RepID=A0A7J5U5G7_9BACT|nr:SDR family oxidoreductase [Rudanella paleaurantiibacter]KAB7733084.1 SDR family NAD(P)-dependent oxidoreductase [Rudanella paleaurantiibacter]